MTEGSILNDNFNEEHHALHKKQAERTLKKAAVIIAILFLVILYFQFKND